MSTTETKHRTITLTDRAPVRISESDWPVIANRKFQWHDNQYRSQANRTRDIFVKVRQHADGRAIVYAGYDTDSQYQGERGASYRTGELLAHAGADADDIVAALHRVADELASRAGAHEDEIRDCMNRCIASLPPVDL